MPRFDTLDMVAVEHAARELAPLLRRRGWFLDDVRADATESDQALVSEALRWLLMEVEDGEAPPYDDEGLLVEIDRSGVVWAKVGKVGFPVARVPAKRDRVADLLRA